MTTKICYTCHLEKESKSFNKNKSNPDGLSNRCRDCRKIHRNNNKLSISIAKHKCYENKLEYYKLRPKIYIQKSYQNFLSSIFHSMKMRSNKRICISNIGKIHNRSPHNIDVNIEYLISLFESQNNRCAISNIPLIHEYGKFNTISLDRINSNLDYVTGNLQFVCQFINLGKSTSSNEHTINFIKKLIGSFNINEIMPQNKNFKYAQKSPYDFIKYKLKRTKEYNNCNITYENLVSLYNIQNGKCALSNIPMTNILGDLSSISIDRINNKICYTSNNIQLVCKFINLGKNKHTNNYVFEFIEALKENYETSTKH